MHMHSSEGNGESTSPILLEKIGALPEAFFSYEQSEAERVFLDDFDPQNPKFSLTAENLKKIPIFRNLSDQDFSSLRPHLKVLRFGRSKTIFTQGSEGTGFYVILSGRCHQLSYDEDALALEQQVITRKELHFGGALIPANSMALVLKKDLDRQFPYTIRVLASGMRGRVLGSEITPLPKEDGSESKFGFQTSEIQTELGPRDFFGEDGVLKRGNIRRNTVVVGNNEDVLVLSISKRSMFDLGLVHKLPLTHRARIRPNPIQVGLQDHGTNSSFFDPHEKPLSTIKTADEIGDLALRIKCCWMLNECLQLSLDKCTELAKQAGRLELAEGESVVKRGHACSNIYFLEEGFCNYSTPVKEGSEASDHNLALARGEGSFGAESCL